MHSIDSHTDGFFGHPEWTTGSILPPAIHKPTIPTTREAALPTTIAINATVIGQFPAASSESCANVLARPPPAWLGEAYALLKHIRSQWRRHSLAHYREQPIGKE
jgi:hypothetical protein